MVHYFTTSSGHTVYMGADKYENEDLLRFGFPEDIWFHVKDLSSAHVYLRLNKNEKLDDINPQVIGECGQLVKANSIQGCKLPAVDVVYTRWRNLKKSADMEIGAVGFHDEKKIKCLKIEKNSATVKTITKTLKVLFPNLQEMQERRAEEHRADMREERRALARTEKQKALERRELGRLQSYESLMAVEQKQSNTNFQATEDDSCARVFEDDFM